MVSIFTAVSSGGTSQPTPPRTSSTAWTTSEKAALAPGTLSPRPSMRSRRPPAGGSVVFPLTSGSPPKRSSAGPQAKKDWVANYLKPQGTKATGLTTWPPTGSPKRWRVPAVPPPPGPVDQQAHRPVPVPSHPASPAPPPSTNWSKALEQGGPLPGSPTSPSSTRPRRKPPREAVDAVHDVLSNTGLDSCSSSRRTGGRHRIKAKQIQEAVQKFVGGNALSQFIDGAERNVVLALNRLVRSIDQKVKNIQRLKIIDAMGFSRPGRPARIARTRTRPCSAEYLDQLFAAGAGEMSTQNARLSAKRAEMKPPLRACLRSWPGRSEELPLTPPTRSAGVPSRSPRLSTRRHPTCDSRPTTSGVSVRSSRPGSATSPSLSPG